MTLRTVLALVMLTLVGGHGYTQVPAPPAVPSLPSIRPIVPSPPSNTPSNRIAPQILPLPVPTGGVSQPKEKSLDQVLDELEALRAQKAEMEKKEKELIKVIQEKAGKQADRMNRLGLAPAAAASAPLRIGRITIEGDAPAGDRVIMKP